MTERYRQLSFWSEPLVRHHANEIQRRQRFENGNEKLNDVFLLGVLPKITKFHVFRSTKIVYLLLQKKILVVQYQLAIDVLHENPKRLGVSVYLFVPLEVRSDRHLDSQRRSGYWLNMRGQFQFWKLKEEKVSGVMVKIRHTWCMYLWSGFPIFGILINSPNSFGPKSYMRSNGRFFFSIFLTTSSGIFLNWRNGHIGCHL